jgi:amino acid adenylation domain-containing protein
VITLLPHLLEHSASRRPEHTAMRFQGQSVSYVALQQQAARLACLLHDQGVQRGDRVGIFLHKSLESAAAIYGILRAGAAYVPIDPLSPPARVEFVVQDCGIRCLISHTPKLPVLRQLAQRGLELDCVIGVSPAAGLPWRCFEWDDAARAPELQRLPRLVEDDLAYIMYTSGSTGKPKGLMHTHASGLAYARQSAGLYGVRPDDILGNHSPLHFDMSTFEYFSGPLAGATTVIIPEAYTKLPASLSALIDSERMTFWYSVPFALIQLLLRGALEQRDLSSLRWVLFGGEPFPAKYLRQLMERLPQARFSNVYGPAEVNQCTYYHLPGPPQDDSEAIPIGQVWDNAEGLVLDENDQSVPAGEPGELVVRTPTMMRGYWGRPDLNERAFYYRPVFEHYQDRFYRTGDLVQEQPDGSLLFLGRKDRQIKTRGYRVEMDEVEKALASHPQVEECAVYAVPEAEGSQTIEAALIMKAGAQVGEAELRRFLAGLLPPYALPAALVFYEAFPRTGSGKIDRRALQEQR